MEQLGLVILPLALSAVTWAAYNHPQEYERFVYVPLAIMGIFALFVILAIQITADVTTSAVMKAAPRTITTDNIDDMYKAGASMRPSGWWVLAPCISIVYLMLLSWLPYMGLTRQNQRKRGA